VAARFSGRIRLDARRVPKCEREPTDQRVITLSVLGRFLSEGNFLRPWGFHTHQNDWAPLQSGSGPCHNGYSVIGKRRALTTCLLRCRWQSVKLGLLTIAIASGGTSLSYGISDSVLGHLRVPKLNDAIGLSRDDAKPPLMAQALTDGMRRRGYSECNPYDFIGLGPYAPYRKLTVGRIAIPQKGGHTADYGYDVVVHFHGQTALRTTLAQVAKGVAFVGIDLGNGSGPYSDEFASRQTWPMLRDSIESALKVQSGNADAHIRHLALMAWSAGYGAVNEILKQYTSEIDAVVLLDGLHAAWDQRLARGFGPAKVAAGPIQPTVEFARLALAGDKIFVFTHSEIDPMLYPSTSLTARFLLDDLGLSAEPAKPSDDPFGLLSAVDVLGLHVWSYRGNDKPAHCTHLSHVDRAVRDIIEPAWDTPAMDRNVPPTPAPRLGTSGPDESTHQARALAADGSRSSSTG